MSTAANIIRDRLARALSAGQACHAFFIAGSDDALCQELAAMAALRVCVGGGEDPSLLARCPDYFEFDGAANIKIAGMRALLSELNHRPSGMFGRAILIKNAHLLTSQVQNALLKTIEEPPANTVFFLTGNAEGVLPTIASRCCVMRVGSAGKDEARERLLACGASPEEAHLYSEQGGGSASRALRLYSEETYRALRASALDALALLLSGGLPGAGKQLAADAAGTLSFMLSYLSDLLCVRLGGEAADNPDRAEEIRRLAGGFTIGKIACMIEILSGANAGIVRAGGGSYYAAAALNRLFLDVSEVVNQ
ncbi:MAG TPA: hypothetical protein VN540_02570 [Clostridia bacterium]|nr:hypothetical protein [Clostridia bacterium]